MDVGLARDARGVRSVEAATAMLRGRRRDGAWKWGRRRGGTCSDEGLLLVDEWRKGFPEVGSAPGEDGVQTGNKD